MIIETERLILRPVTTDDAQDIYEYSKEPEVGSNAGWEPHKSIEETRELMELIFLDKDGVFAIELKESNKVIGTIGLVDDSKRENENVRMLGYAISQKYWGNGFMTEAAKAVIDYGFNKLNLNLISAYCYPDNERSKSVIRKCGFSFEGTLRLCETLFDGSVKDNECFSLIKE